MELNIGATIKRLRKNRGITQEELASAIGVTTQAISKWERGEGYPDITFLPDIAEYFSVTLDTLCGIDERRNKEQISSIINATADASYEEGIKIAREGLSKFPYSVLLKNNLAQALMGCTENHTVSKDVAKEVIGLYEDLLHHGTDINDLSPNVPFLLCKAYISIGKREKAKQIALQIHGKRERDRVWCQFLKDEELVIHVQNSVIQLLPDIHFMIKDLLNTSCYEAKEKISLCEKMIGIYQLYDECRQWPIGLIFSYQLYVKIAALAIKMNDMKGSFTALDKAADLAIRTDLLPDEGKPASLLINRIEFQYLSDDASEKAQLLKEIEEEPTFEAIRKTSEYKRIISRLL